MTPLPLLLFPSRWARISLLGLHLTAVSVGCLLPWSWCLGVITVVTLHLLWSFRSCPRVQSLQVLPDAKVAVFLATGERLEAECLPSSRVTAWLMVLHLRHATGRVDLALWSDSASAEALRQWRVWLRWHLPAQQRRQAKVDASEI